MNNNKAAKIYYSREQNGSEYDHLAIWIEAVIRRLWDFASNQEEDKLDKELATLGLLAKNNGGELEKYYQKLTDGHTHRNKVKLSRVAENCDDNSLHMKCSY